MRNAHAGEEGKHEQKHVKKHGNWMDLMGFDGFLHRASTCFKKKNKNMAKKHIFGFFLKHVEARCKKPSNPIKSHQIPSNPHISSHIISYHITTYIPNIKLGTAVSAAEAAEAASTVPLHAFASWNPFGEHPPYRIGAPDRRQFLGTIKLQPSRSTQNLTCFWHFFGFS